MIMSQRSWALWPCWFFIFPYQHLFYYNIYIYLWEWRFLLCVWLFMKVVHVTLDMSYRWLWALPSAGAGNWTLVHCKSSKPSQTLSHLSLQPPYYYVSFINSVLHIWYYFLQLAESVSNSFHCILCLFHWVFHFQYIFLKILISLLNFLLCCWHFLPFYWHVLHSFLSRVWTEFVCWFISLSGHW